LKFKIIHQLKFFKMKNMKNIALLLATLAAGNSAWAQQATYAQGCKSYTFIGTPAAGSGDITYQWYRNGNPIPNANGKDYILPLKEAYGENVEFKRGVMSSGCVGEVAFSAPFYLTFSGVKIDTICWAHTNVDAPNTFALKPDMYASFYQWNRLTACPASGLGVDWNTTPDLSATWIVNPCPSGWRLPTNTEFLALQEQSSTWADAHTRGNDVPGRFYGFKSATCALPSNMVGCVFLTAGGGTACAGIGSQNINGAYWSSTELSSTHGFRMNFDNTASNAMFDSSKSSGYNIRCVQ
jgi:uncharacterized protein (TIGR02145 family)